MSAPSFLKVTLVPDSTLGSGIMDIDILLPNTVIISIRKKIGFEYEILVPLKVFQQLESHYFGNTVRLKEIKAKIKDESILF